MDLPDLNVWLALSARAHPHHATARHYWEHQAADAVLFCTVTAIGLVRLLCQPRVMGAQTLSTAEASQVLQDLLAQPGVQLATETGSSWDLFHHLLNSHALPSRLCTDAHLAALAIAGGWRLVSFDSDFQRFANCSRLHLSP